MNIKNKILVHTLDFLCLTFSNLTVILHLLSCVLIHFVRQLQTNRKVHLYFYYSGSR